MLLGKNRLWTSWGPEKFQCHTILVALFEIRVTSIFFNVEKRRPCSEVTTIPCDLLSQICSREMLLDCIAMGIS